MTEKDGDNYANYWDLIKDKTIEKLAKDDADLHMMIFEKALEDYCKKVFKNFEDNPYRESNQRNDYLCQLYTRVIDKFTVKRKQVLRRRRN